MTRRSKKTRPSLPSGGGSYLRESDGTLKPATATPAPDAAPPERKSKPAAQPAAEKED